MGGNYPFRGGKKVTGYLPSFKAFVFNLRGAYKPGKLAASGLDIRPITPNFRIMKQKPLRFGGFAA
jgi:hypothetical protein